MQSELSHWNSSSLQVTLQTVSSLPSVQSECPSHVQSWGMQLPSSRHWNSPGAHRAALHNSSHSSRPSTCDIVLRSKTNQRGKKSSPFPPRRGSPPPHHTARQGECKGRCCNGTPQSGRLKSLLKNMQVEIPLGKNRLKSLLKKSIEITPEKNKVKSLLQKKVEISPEKISRLKSLSEKIG